MHSDLFSKITSIENLFDSWNEFKKGKRRKPDVQRFERDLEENLFTLHDELNSKIYKHSHYTSFFINDPKRRHIHKACVRDRIVHHAIYRILYPIFDKGFIYDSYSCRNGKGTHKAVERLQGFIRRGDPMWSPVIMKCDIKKFFASIDHEILFSLIKKKIADEDVLWLVREIIDSFAEKQNEREREREREYKNSGTRNSARQPYLPALCQYLS
jgi:retron-type reverse transcriptase